MKNNNLYNLYISNYKRFLNKNENALNLTDKSIEGVNNFDLINHISEDVFGINLYSIFNTNDLSRHTISTKEYDDLINIVISYCDEGQIDLNRYSLNIKNFLGLNERKLFNNGALFYNKLYSITVNNLCSFVDTPAEDTISFKFKLLNISIQDKLKEILEQKNLLIETVKDNIILSNIVRAQFKEPVIVQFDKLSELNENCMMHNKLSEIASVFEDLEVSIANKIYYPNNIEGNDSSFSSDSSDSNIYNECLIEYGQEDSYDLEIKKLAPNAMKKIDKFIKE